LQRKQEVNTGGVGKRRNETRIGKGGTKRRNARKTKETGNNRKSESSGGGRADTSHCSNISFFVASDITVGGKQRQRKRRQRRPNGGKGSV